MPLFAISFNAVVYSVTVRSVIGWASSEGPDGGEAALLPELDKPRAWN
jgi:hypothetical protein